MESERSKTGKTIFFESLGCPKNLVDTEVMLGISQQHHYQVVTDPQTAQVIVVNTCSFINDSKSESIDSILNLAEHKKTGQCERLVVAGCLPQRYKADLKVSFPEVDAFVGTGQYGRILEFIEGRKEDESGFRHPKYIHSENTPRVNTQPSHRAFLKISEGCMKNCSFCIIPKIRGQLRSRTIESLVLETQQLALTGVKEISVISQDLTDYGKDLNDGSHLAALLRALAKVEGIEWIRLLYLYPDEMSDELIDLIATEPKLCPYIDMPTQHVNDRMLKLMNRKVTGELIKGRIRKLRERLPNVSLRSTLIVGYPSETEAEFEELKDYVREMEFDHLGIFAYSKEENTLSNLQKGHLPDDVKQARRDELMQIQQEISEKRLKRHVGETMRVLVEGPSEESEFLLQARHQGQAPDIDGIVLLRNAQFKRGDMIDVKIEEAMEYDLIAVPESFNETIH